MRRIAVLLVAVVALAAMVAYMPPVSGQAKKATRDELAGKLARREVQRSPLSIPGREIVQVETLFRQVWSPDGTFILEKRSATSLQARSR